MENVIKKISKIFKKNIPSCRREGMARSNFPANHKGFSFMEAMISVFVITVSLLAAVALITKGLTESIDSRNRIIASLLAQEGAELVRNIRDNNWLNGQASFADLPGTNQTDCRVDYQSVSITGADCGAGVDKKLYRIGAFFLHGVGGVQSSFQRKIMLTYQANNLTVASLVSWKGSATSFNPGNCTAAAGCAYAQVTLSKWGGN